MNDSVLINSNYNDCYFSEEGGYRESQYVFVCGNDIPDKLNTKLSVGETGFGTGLNLLVLEDYILSREVRDLQVIYTSVEKYPLSISKVDHALSRLDGVSCKSLSRHLDMYSQLMGQSNAGWNSLVLKRVWGELVVNIFLGDVMDSFSNYPAVVDTWFLDGHSPDKNPEMWSVELFKLLADNSTKGTTFATFTAAGIVKRGLREAGFFVKRKRGFGQKRHMISGSL